MFKIGDKVVCVNNNGIIYSLMEDDRLVLYKVYTVSESGYPFISFDEFEEDAFKWNKFISLSQFRKQKINKILDKIKWQKIKQQNT